ncbi:MAG: CapA family protein [Spirochaetia bacterium]|nr:CapA family protein [Spirochaetia bacterium]
MDWKGVKRKWALWFFFFAASAICLGAPLLSQSDTAPDPQAETVSLWFGGDTHFSWGVEQEQRDGDPVTPFREILPLLRRMDFRAINLESAVCTTCTAMPGKYYVFNSGPKSLSSLRSMGIDMVFLGNNHSMDMGADGLAETLKNLKATGIGWAGAGPTESDAGAPFVVTLNGITFSIFSFNEIQENGVTAGLQTPGTISTRWGFAQRIRAAHQKSDHVIVSLHWGVEYVTAPSQSQIDLAHALIDAGADAVIGHHPHVPQGIEFYKSGVIVYSLGNFLFGSATVQQSNNFSAELIYSRTRNRLESVRVHPIFGKFRAGGHKLRLLTDSESAEFWSELRMQCRELNGRKDVPFTSGEDGSGLFSILPGS